MRLLLLLALASSALSQQTWYVNESLATGANDGSSWADAFQGSAGLKRASLDANPGDTIYVAAGTYKPSLGQSPDDSIELKDGVRLFGGFQGTESGPEQRPPIGTAPTVLSGLPSKRCLKVIGAINEVVVDGLTVTGAYADDPSVNWGAGIQCIGSVLTLRNIRFHDNYASNSGCAGTFSTSTLLIQDCVFEDNGLSASGGPPPYAAGALSLFQTEATIERSIFRRNIANLGGAVYLAEGDVNFHSCLFHANEARDWGAGAVHRHPPGGTMRVRGCTFVSNRSNGPVGGVSFATKVKGCVFWGNEAAPGAPSPHLGGADSVAQTLVPGGAAGDGNIDADPRFVDEGNHDFRLRHDSPCIDAGGGPLLVGDLDLARSPRRVDDPLVADTGVGNAPVIDMGAYEYGLGQVSEHCHPAVNTTGKPGVLSATGSLALADNDVTLMAQQLPPGEFGYLVTSSQVSPLPVGSGVLCLGARHVRFSQNGLNTGTGTASHTLDLNALPHGLTMHPGDTWHFQFWHTDGTTSNFSSELHFTWE